MFRWAVVYLRLLNFLLHLYATIMLHMKIWFDLAHCLQINLELSPLTYLASDPDRPTHLLNDLFTNTQSESCSIRVLGR